MNSEILIYSSVNHKNIYLNGITETELVSLWDEFARGSEVINGWTNGCMRIKLTPKTRSNFEEIEKRYANKFPQIQRIKPLLRSLNEDEFIYLLNRNKASLAEIMSALAVLNLKQVNYAGWIGVHNYMFDVWSRISLSYDTYVFGNDNVANFTGQKDKRLRQCRFCGTKDIKKFSEKAHAIPHAIGNDTLFCYEECDDCNHDLRPIEENFTRLMDFRRAFYNISSKDRNDESPKIKGENYSIAPDEYGSPVLYIKQSNKPRTVTPDGREFYKFDHYENVVDQDVYRALVKMVIDLLPSDRLCHFRETINWILNKEKILIHDALPSILFGILPNGSMFKRPMMCLFFRKIDTQNIPYCTAVLFITDIAYQFVIPLADVDNGRFRYDEELIESRNGLNRYFNIQWELQPFFSWWQSNVWAIHDIDPNSTKVIKLPDNDPIFKPVRLITSEIDRAYERNIFKSGDIQDFQVEKLEIPDLISPLVKNKFGTKPLKCKKTEISFQLFISKGQCKTIVNLEIEYNHQIICISSTLLFNVRRLDRLYSKDKYITGASFGSLAECSVLRTLRIIDRQISLKCRKQNLKLLQSLYNRSWIKESEFKIVLPNQNIIKTNYHYLVGE